MTEVENLKKAILQYSNKMNNELKNNHSRQRIEGLLNSLYIELERLQNERESGKEEESLTKEEKLASMMLKVSSVLRGGNVSVCSEVADEFLKALELFELAREVKEAGKLAAIKDRYDSV